MKRNIYLTGLLLTVASLLSSCGEDRTHEYIEKTEEDQWIANQMKDVYLYYQEIPELKSENYFYPVDEFFPMLLASHDRYSYLEMKEESRTRSYLQPVTYGMDVVVSNDPTGTTTHQTARILLVLPGSPAEQAGIKRGDYITAINGKNVSSSNADLLMTGSGVSLTLSTPMTDPTTGNIVWMPETREVTLPAAVAMENNPFFVQKVIERNGRKIGYLVYNEFMRGRDDNNTDDVAYMQQMLSVFQQFRQAGVNDFILDLRYNQGGYVTSAQELGSLLAPSSALGEEFAHFEFNDKRQDLNYALNLDPQYSSYNLNLGRLFIISGLYTASASEMMINCLRPYMEVNLIGVTTTGKNVAMTRIDSPYDFVIYPVTSTVYNAKGESDYASGFEPRYVINELSYFPWYDLGDERELLLANTLEWVEGNIPPNAENTGSTEEPETPEEPENPENPDTSTDEGTSPTRFTRALTPGYSTWQKKHLPAAILTE